jgi:hypothetical protein
MLLTLLICGRSSFGENPMPAKPCTPIRFRPPASILKALIRQGFSFLCARQGARRRIGAWRRLARRSPSLSEIRDEPDKYPVALHEWVAEARTNC